MAAESASSNFTELIPAWLWSAVVVTFVPSADIFPSAWQTMQSHASTDSVVGVAPTTWWLRPLKSPPTPEAAVTCRRLGVVVGCPLLWQPTQSPPVASARPR